MTLWELDSLVAFALCLGLDPKDAYPAIAGAPQEGLMTKRMILGKEVEDDDIRKIAGARCWIEDGWIVKAKKVRATGDRTDAWIAKEAPVAVK